MPLDQVYDQKVLESCDVSVVPILSSKHEVSKISELDFYAQLLL